MAATSKRSSPRSKRIATITALVIGILLIGGLVLHLSSQTPPETVPNSDLYPLMNTVSNAVSTQYTEYAGLKRTWLAETATGAAVPVPGYEFSITTDSYPNVLIYAPATHFVDDPRQFVTPAHDLAIVNKVIASVFSAQGFFGQIDQDNQSVAAPKTIYTKQAQAESCTTTEDLTYYQVHIVCSSPRLQQQLAAQAKPFVSLYLKANRATRAADITFGPLAIKSKDARSSPIGASTTAGYDLAEALFRFSDGSKRLALYYQKDDGPWHYIAKAGDEFGFSCSVIEANPDASKAMDGKPCYDHSKQRISQVGS